MVTNVVTISGDTIVEDAIAKLLELDISGAPIVDREGHLIGIISEFQLLEAIYSPEVKKSQVSRLMTRDVFTVTEDMLLSEVANLLVLHRIRRTPVVRDRQVVGIISRRDLLRYVLDAGEKLDEFLGAVHGLVQA